LSVAADHERLICVELVAVALRPVGAVGGWESVAAGVVALAVAE
jgi:hypothetical protein